MRILIFQHADSVYPGVFRRFLDADRADITTLNLAHGETIPALDGFDALWVMGGPMDVWEEDAYPWLALEKRAIAEAVAERGMAYFGLCLGHQLLAEALGGEVGRAAIPEVGVLPVDLNPQGLQSPWFTGVETGFHVLQWHYAEIIKPPVGSTVLASTPACRAQVLAWGERALSMQFHLEANGRTVEDWRAIPGTDDLIVAAMGEGGANIFTRAMRAREAEAHAVARRVYDNWKAVALAP